MYRNFQLEALSCAEMLLECIVSHTTSIVKDQTEDPRPTYTDPIMYSFPPSASCLFVCLMMFGLEHKETPNGATFWLCLSGSLLMMLEGVILLLVDLFWKQEEEEAPRIEITLRDPSLPPVNVPINPLNVSSLLDQSFANSETNLIWTSQNDVSLPKVIGRRQQKRESQRRSRAPSSVEDYYNMRFSTSGDAPQIQTVRDPIVSYGSQYESSWAGSQLGDVSFGGGNYDGMDV